jgi:hypothetical protein
VRSAREQNVKVVILNGGEAGVRTTRRHAVLLRLVGMHTMRPVQVTFLAA